MAREASPRRTRRAPGGAKFLPSTVKIMRFDAFVRVLLESRRSLDVSCVCASLCALLRMVGA